ncbi:MAG TPA: DPP IV N-terminal domain-containing protein [Anaerolineae bacterium]
MKGQLSPQAWFLLSTGIVLAVLVTGLCLLGAFVYYLPVILPPPSISPQGFNYFTLTPASVSAERTPTSTTLVAVATSRQLPTLSPDISSTPSIPSPVAIPGNSHIVFVTERKGYNSIFIMNADGTGQRLLIPHDGSYYDYAPAISPDGRRLAFSSNREKPGTDNIYIMSMDGTDFTKITATQNAKNWSSSWFPDGRRLAFCSNRQGHWQAFTMNDDGSDVKSLVSSNEDVINVEVSPNGSAIAYLCGKEICLANSDGTNPRVLLQNGLPKDHLAWSPDSARLAFSQLNPNTGKTSVNVLDLQASPRQLVENGGWPSWSPDGTRIVFSSDMSGVANLYRYDFATAQVVRLTTIETADYTPVWTRN